MALSQLNHLKELLVFTTSGCNMNNLFVNYNCEGFWGTVPEELCHLSSLDQVVVNCHSSLMESCPEECCNCFF